MYYVYEFYIVDTDEIVYVGKGTGRRYKVTSQRNELLTKMLAQNSCESRTKTGDKDRGRFYVSERRDGRKKTQNRPPSSMFTRIWI